MCIGWVLQTSPSNHYWRRYLVGQWLGFRWFWGCGTSDTQLARRKLSKNNTLRPWHGGRGRRHPTAAMVPCPQRRHIQQSANMLCDKSMLLKLKNIFVRKNSSNTCFFRKCDPTASWVIFVTWQQHSEENLVLNPKTKKSCFPGQHFEFFQFQSVILYPCLS